jgi:hypothetical protein
LPENWVAFYSRYETLQPVMITIHFVEQATACVKTARDSVCLIKEGGFYAPTVRTVVKDLGQRAMENFIKAQLVSLNVVLNLARPMSEALIEASAPLVVRHILDDDCDVNLADLRIIFDRAKTGMFGDYYNGIGLADICGWIDAYICEKCAEFERWHQNNYKQTRL